MRGVAAFSLRHAAGDSSSALPSYVPLPSSLHDTSLYLALFQVIVTQLP